MTRMIKWSELLSDEFLYVICVVLVRFGLFMRSLELIDNWNGPIDSSYTRNFR